MGYNVDSQYWRDEEGVVPPQQENPKSFVDRMHTGEFGRGHLSLTEALMNLRTGQVVCCADNDKYYVTSQWASKRYQRYVGGASS